MNYLSNRIIEKFGGKEFFSREELFAFFKEFEPNLNKNTFGWRIYDLKSKNIIKSIRRGVYSISSKPVFKPVINRKIKHLGKIISNKFNTKNYSIWNTSWLNEFIIHQTTKNLTILEIDKSIVEPVFFYLKDNNYKNIYMNPKENIMDHYVSEEYEVLIVNPLITRAPTQKIESIKVPTLEKILVDVFCDKVTLYSYKGEELINIFDNAFNKYSINFSKLLYYVRRRKRENSLKEFITNNFPKIIQEISE